jgi:hypothetical protein
VLARPHLREVRPHFSPAGSFGLFLTSRGRKQLQRLNAWLLPKILTILISGLGTINARTCFIDILIHGTGFALLE